MTATPSPLQVTVASCDRRDHIVVMRLNPQGKVVSWSKNYAPPSVGIIDGVLATDRDHFSLDYFLAYSYANPSTINYSFHYTHGRWVLESMSYQGTRSCNDESGVDADAYQIDFLTGTVVSTQYQDCSHHTTHRVTVKPVTMPLEDFDPSDDRLSPFQFD